MPRSIFAIPKNAGILRIAVLFLLAVAVQFAAAIQAGASAYKGTLEDFNSNTITAAGPMASLTSAVTRDINGNGLIDRVDVRFNSTMTITQAMTGSIRITGNGVTFAADSIIQIADSSCAVYLKEQNTGVPQTSWLPAVSIANLPGVADILNFLAIDGCPPVVWEVKKNIADNNRTHDTVKIFLSEKITSATGANFSIINLPAETFTVWAFNRTEYLRNDSMLAGISNFTAIYNDSILVFQMSNGHDLGTVNYISIRADNLPIRDRAGNFSALNNQKVRVEISGGVLTSILIVGYNNFSVPYDFNLLEPPLLSATDKRELPGVFHAEHNPNAYNWVSADRAGAVIMLYPARELDFLIDSTMTLSISITDDEGKTIQRASNTDFRPSLPPGSFAIFPLLTFYWNCFDRKGNTLAGGKYAIRVNIDFANPAINDVSAQTSFELPGGKKHCGCGTGTGLALLPPIGFKIGSWYRRRKRDFMNKANESMIF